MTVSGKTIGENYRGAVIMDEKVIRPFDRPLKERAGFRVLSGNIFDSAMMKMSVVSAGVPRPLPVEPRRIRTASRAGRWCSTGRRTTTRRIDDPALAIDADTMLFMRGAGPKGYPGAAEVVNMRAPDYLLKQGVSSLVCVGDGRQSGTSRLAVDPERLARRRRRAAALALIETGDRVRARPRTPGGSTCWSTTPSWRAGARRWRRRAATAIPAHQTPWQEIQRGLVGELETGAVLEPAVKYQRIAQTKGIPRDNH